MSLTDPVAGGSDPAADDGYSLVTGVMNAVGTVWIFAIMVLVNADIFGRDFLDAPVRGTTELIGLSIVGIVYLQLAHTLRAGRLTRSDALVDALQRRKPRLAALLSAVHHLVGGFLMAVIFWFSLPYFLDAWQTDEYVGAIGDFTAPTWPIKLIILIGCAATVIQFGLFAFRDLRKALGAGS